MLHSLRWRLLLSFALVIAVALGMTAFFASQAARVEMRKADERAAQEREQRLQELLTQQQYIQRGGWQDLQPALEMAGRLYGQRVILVDARSVVVADSMGVLVGRTVERIKYGRRIPVVNQEGQRGTLLIDAGPLPGVDPATSSPPEVLEGSPEVVEGSINNYLIWSGALAGAVALLLTFFLSWRFLAPVGALSRAAQSIAQRDFSHRVKVVARDEMGELSRTFNTMVEELGRTEELRRNMVADVAHELRTPLSNIRGFVEAMRDGVVSADATTLESIHEEVLLLSRLVDDLQELALAEAGQLKLNSQACDLADITRKAVFAIQPQAEAKGLTLRYEGVERLEIEGDQERLGQVVRNLLSNAVKYTAQGGSVTAAVSDLGAQAQAQVRDTGIGIAPDDLPHVFDRFYRADKSRARATGGVGLGLTIARELVSAHGGSIEVQSQVGVGSTFSFQVPKRPAKSDRTS